MLSHKDKRARRIERRATPEVAAAYASGAISARRADTLLYLPVEKQKAELERRLSEARTREHKNRLVADTIRRYLDSLNGRQPDLHQLSGLIKAALL